MKSLIPVVLLTIAAGALADDSVRGYTKRDGTYVAPHMRTEPNSQRFDNYSSHGNTNPYTGQRGSERNEFTNPPQFNQPRATPQPTYESPYNTQRSRKPF